ncbi:MAG: hypothetical protein GXP25_06915 [Planctomycetes bacterium]|nr:hypothetical protein [Planctomycetota bacterium]
MLVAAVVFYFVFLFAGGILLHVVTPGRDADNAPLGVKVFLVITKIVWVLVTAGSGVFAMLKAKPEFAVYFWRGDARLLGCLASANAVAFLLLILLHMRKERSLIRFLLIPVLFFMIAMPLVVHFLPELVPPSVPKTDRIMLPPTFPGVPDVPGGVMPSNVGWGLPHQICHPSPSPFIPSMNPRQ